MDDVHYSDTGQAVPIVHHPASSGASMREIIEADPAAAEIAEYAVQEALAELERGAITDIYASIFLELGRVWPLAAAIAIEVGASRETAEEAAKRLGCSPANISKGRALWRSKISELNELKRHAKSEG